MSKSLAGQFLDFCRSRPADEEYDYCATGECAFARFLDEYGYAKLPSVGPQGWRDLADTSTSERRPLPIADSVLVEDDWTFGALADRLEAALAEQVSA